MFHGLHPAPGRERPDPWHIACSRVGPVTTGVREVQTFRLAPDGAFWRLTRSGDPGLPQLFDSRSTALDAAILLAEQSAPCRLVIVDPSGVVEADLGFGLNDASPAQP